MVLMHEWLVQGFHEGALTGEWGGRVGQGNSRDTGYLKHTWRRPSRLLFRQEGVIDLRNVTRMCELVC